MKAFVFFAVLLTSAIAQATAMAVVTYEAEWEGQPFEEKVDPLARFAHFPLADADGDGFGEVAPVPAPPTPVVEVMVLHPEINAQIDELLASKGRTRASLAADLVAFSLQANSEVPAIADIVVAIQEGDYVKAVGLGLGSGLEVSYFCGASVIRRVSWMVGVPIPADCGGDFAYDAIFDAQPLTASPRGADTFSSVWLDVTVEQIENPAFRNRVIALGYQSHILTIESRPQTLIELRLDIRGLYTETVAIGTTLYVPNSLLPGDALSYTYGATPFASTTVWLDVRLATATFLFNIEVNLSDGLSVGLGMGDHLVFEQIRANIMLAGDRSVPVHVKGFPAQFRVGYRAVWSGVGGNYYYVDLSSASGAMPSLEIRGTFYEGSGPEFSFQLVGFPQYNSLRISPGPGAGGCGSTNTFSLDLSKRYDWSPGRYRSIAVTGHACDKAISLTGSNLHRMHIVSSPKDAWNGGRIPNVLLMTGASANVAYNSFLNIDANVPWSPDLATRLEYLTADRAMWHKTVGGYYNAGGLQAGQYLIENGIAVNAYYWAISESQLDQNTCLLRYSDGRCA